MHCKEICTKYSMKNQLLKETGRYGGSQKRCSSCEIYINWNGEHCPCCGHFLRTKPRNTSGRNKLNQKIILEKFQLKLNLNQDTINYSKRLFDKLAGKSPFKYQSPNLIMAVCIFIASRFKGQQKSVKKISKVFQIKEVDLELCCDMALDEIKEILLIHN